MGEAEIQKYCDLMEEIKRRTAVVDFFHAGGGHALYLPTTVESVALQLRKIMELIALGSLVANKEHYSAAYEKFATHWHAGRILRDVEKINPDFYPKPVMEGPHYQLMDRQPDYLSKGEFEAAYEECGPIMHAENPYGARVDYHHYRAKLPEWRTKIVNLLNNHQIRLLGETGFWLIHMKEDRDDKAHYYKFVPEFSKASGPPIAPG
ncbi:MAG: hypothetical protein ACRD4X_04810 [Candidatus Acidiferrales bacterium]